MNEEIADKLSIEKHDALIDDAWFVPGEVHSRIPTGLPLLPHSNKFSAEDEDHSAPFYSRWIRSAYEKALLRRIEQFKKVELKTFIAQKLFKVDGVVCDEQTRLVLIEKMLLEKEEKTRDEREQELSRKYGEDLVSWLLDRLLPSVSDCGELIDRAMNEYSRLRALDPLHTWIDDTPERTARVVRTVQAMAAAMASKVRWSILVEPGNLTCHLLDFITEFARLENFFVNNPLSHAETSQASFNANYLTKARSKLLPCVDVSRVVLRPLRDRDGHVAMGDEQFKRSRLIGELFGDEDIPDVADAHDAYGTTDFIHASYVRGGPLMNTFICTQAPLEHTQADFWRMVYQEKARFIVMLCAAVDTNELGVLDNRQLNYCPYYWPRQEGKMLKFGNLQVRNVRVDGTADPLFTVTHLELRRTDEVSEEPLLVEHWQWDWRHYSDYHWPYRILRRARLCPSPTVVHCMDGCGRTGTLITIEVALMQFLRGSPQPSEIVFVSALFTRLQRRGAIMDATQYLFIYRTLLHWAEPYVSSLWQRFALGIGVFQAGFVAKYDKYLREHTKISPSF